jgi:hypothetical protein
MLRQTPGQTAVLSISRKSRPAIGGKAAHQRRGATYCGYPFPPLPAAVVGRGLSSSSFLHRLTSARSSIFVSKKALEGAFGKTVRADVECPLWG